MQDSSSKHGSNQYRHNWFKHMRDMRGQVSTPRVSQPRGPTTCTYPDQTHWLLRSFLLLQSSGTLEVDEAILLATAICSRAHFTSPVADMLKCTLFAEQSAHPQSLCGSYTGSCQIMRSKFQRPLTLALITHFTGFLRVHDQAAKLSLAAFRSDESTSRRPRCLVSFHSDDYKQNNQPGSPGMPVTVHLFMSPLAFHCQPVCPVCSAVASREHRRDLNQVGGGAEGQLYLAWNGWVPAWLAPLKTSSGIITRYADKK